jgi:predicted metal-binding membrane protein
MSAHAVLKTTRWRDRLLILGGLAVLTLLAWGVMAEMAGRMNDAPAAAHLQAWSVSDFAVAFGMWSVMMMGMMLPSASPMVLTFAGISRRRAPDHSFLRTSLFVGGYLLVWIGYSAGAALLQGGFQAAALLTPMGASASPHLAGGLLVGAGLYQWTPLKDACLTGCRTPMGFLMAEWRPGRRGALVMGWRHGWNCAGCCWATMALMFVLGVMNLLWMAALTALCLIEKIAPAGDRIGRFAGIGFIGWGVWLIAGALL